MADMLQPTDAPVASAIAAHAGIEGNTPLHIDIPGKTTTAEPVSSPLGNGTIQSAPVRQTYTDALLNGEVKGPQEFSQGYVGSLLGAARDGIDPADDSEEARRDQLTTATVVAKRIEARLPTHEDLIDHSIALTAAAGIPPTVAAVTATKYNLASMFAETGSPPAAIFAQALKDPVLHDALTLPPAFSPVSGLLKPGNIDVHNRPIVKTEEGQVATVRSISIGTGKGEVLIPTVSNDGKILSNRAAIALYEKTGQHLGIFDNAANANAYAEILHEQQGQEYVEPRGEKNPNGIGEKIEPATLEELMRPGRDMINPVSMLGEPVEHKSIVGDLEDLGVTIVAVVGGGYVLKFAGKIVGSIVKAAANKPAAGMVRLYRAESAAGETPVPDWVRESEFYKNAAEARGRWFTQEPDSLEWYQNENRGKIHFVDVPKADLEKYRVSNIKEKTGGKETRENPRAFSARPEQEFYVPSDIALQRQEQLTPGKYIINGLGNLLADESGALKLPPRTPQEAKESIDAAIDRLSKARKKTTPTLPPPKSAGDVKAIVTKIDDDLNRLRTNAAADKVVLAQMLDKLPPEWRQPKFQESVSVEVERRLMRVNSPIPDDIQAFLDGVKALTDRQTELGVTVRKKLENVALTDPSVMGIKSVDEGYVHRIVIGKQPRGSIADPNTEADVITGGPVGSGRSLTKFAPGMQGRSMYVLEGEDGTRLWGTEPLTNIRNPALAPEEVGKPFVRQMATFGDKITAGDGGVWTIQPATMEEVEGNTSVRYYKNFLANTVENVARLERINRNIDFLQEHAKDLEAAGLFIPKPPGKMPGANIDALKRVELPGMDGWAEPRIADVLNDFFAKSQGDLESFLTRASRFIVSSLFISPIVHLGNVGAHWNIGRGWDWIKPAGYGSLVKDGLDAFREVVTMGPRYIEHLREGSGLLYASTQTENFHNMMMTKLFHEQAAGRQWSDYVTSLMGPGYAVADLVRAEYRASRKILWGGNDIFMLQRQFELERQGMSTRQAIFEAEKDIPNYRVPSEVMGSHAMSEALQDPRFINFGRYNYGLMRALALMVHDLVGPAATGQERLDAVGKFTALGALALGAYPMANYGINYIGKALTGDDGWSVRKFGPLGRVNAAYELLTGSRDWPAAVSSFITLGPLLGVVRMVAENLDHWGRPVVNNKATWIGKVVQGLEATANEFYPSQLILQALQNGKKGVERDVANLIGLLYKPPVDPEAQKKWDARAQAEATTRERRDTIEQWLKRQLGIQDDTTHPSPRSRTAPAPSTGGGEGWTPTTTPPKSAPAPSAQPTTPARPQTSSPPASATTVAPWTPMKK